MSHITGTLQPVTPAILIGPDAGSTPTPGTWTHNFSHTPAPGGTKFVLLHFRNATFPGSNRMEVDLGYDTDVFDASAGTDFWTRPVNIHMLSGGLVPIRYITNGATTGSVQLDKYGRGERHSGESGHPSFSNSDPFLPGSSYTEPTYDPFWLCGSTPNWENIVCVTSASDIRRLVARSVGMIVTIHGDHVSTCSVTLIGPDLVITAGHCLASPTEEVPTSSVTFDYQVNCNGSKPGGYNARFHKVIRAVKWRNNIIGGLYHDYAILQLKVPPGGLGIPPVNMRLDLPAIGEQIFGVHHPNGAVKKLSVPNPGFATVLNSNAGAVRVNLDVSGGSSGSGLFDTSGRIVGVLSTGTKCSLSYFPTATLQQDISAPDTPPITRDVMIVFDRSGSMSMDAGTGRTKIVEARDAASLFVQLVRAGTGNRIGLVSFSTSASVPVDFALASVTAAAKDTLIGPAPFSGGVVGTLTPDGMTTIGGGLQSAHGQFPAPGANPRTILLLTDGLQNTPPMIETVEPSLSGIDVNAIGFGTEASLNGALLTGLAQRHNGIYTRAGDGLTLKKFFALAFGNIFEAGTLMDPEHILKAGERTGTPIPFNVCDEESVTVVVGWEREDTPLLVQVTTPLGATITPASSGVEFSTGRTWTFLRIPLPFDGERDGVWNITVSRAGRGGDIEFSAAAVAVRYFANVIASGGPKLNKMPQQQRYYTGDTINPLVALKYPDGTFPPNATMQVTVTRPRTSIGNILSQARLRPPITHDGDTIPAHQATLLAVEAETGGPAVTYTEVTFDLFDDAAHEDGTFEPDGIFGNPLKDLLIVEGSYTFHFKATYGDDCIATRELVWSVQVSTSVDPSHTDITSTVTGTRPDGTRDVTITLIPRDRYGNLVGPGRLEDLTFTGISGTTITGETQDNGDGSYTVPGSWDPNSGHDPGVVIGQPDRPPVVQEPKPPQKEDCLWCKLLLLLLLLLLLVSRKRPHKKRSHRR